jgi:flagellar motor switch protein FliN
MIAQFRIPKWNTRLAVGLEVPLAHAVVDGLLGYDRPLAETRLQLTPVEWGVWSYLVVVALAHGEPQAGESADAPAETWPGLLLDRVGPDPFDPTDLGDVVTVRWPVRIGGTAGTVRLWIGESALMWFCDRLPRPPSARRPVGSRMVEFSSTWRAEAGSVPMPQGLKRLRSGGVLPVDWRLTGTPQGPTGPILLVCTLSGAGGRFLIPAETVEGSAGRLVRLAGPLRQEPAPREPLTVGTNAIMTPNSDPPAAPEIPVTLTVELGRLNVTLGRLADLKPGDVLELGRHSREPVELTSGGRLVARGELILIDTELGVRVTSVFL